MAPVYGTKSLIDTLASFDATNIQDYGLDRLQANLDLIMRVHNRMMDELLATFITPTTDKIRRYGNFVRGEWIEVDEFGAADTQKVAFAGVDVGFPLRSFQFATGWTDKYFDKATPADEIASNVAMRDGDYVNLIKAIKRALFTSTNNLSYVDRLDNGVTLPVRALLNADGTFIPPDQFGNEFTPGTHTHYLANATLTDAAVQSAVDTVVEHGLDGGELRIYINRADEGTVTAMASFDRYSDPLLRPGGGSTADVAVGGLYNREQGDDKAIGLWDGWAEVWLKPWVPANYVVVVVLRNRGPRVIAMRRDTYPGAGQIRPRGGHRHLPLSAEHWERDFGMGVWRRDKAAVLFAAGGTYVIPAITA
jgi:hypothetical protein